MAEANQQEPSMEEILSSIRRIISADTPAEEAKAPADEEAAAAPPPPPPPEEEPEAEEDEDVLELTDVVEPDSDDELDIDVDQEIDSFEPAAHFGEPEVADEVADEFDKFDNQCPANPFLAWPSDMDQDQDWLHGLK